MSNVILPSFTPIGSFRLSCVLQLPGSVVTAPAFGGHSSHGLEYREAAGPGPVGVATAFGHLRLQGRVVCDEESRLAFSATYACLSWAASMSVRSPFRSACFDFIEVPHLSGRVLLGDVPVLSPGVGPPGGHPPPGDGGRGGGAICSIVPALGAHRQKGELTGGSLRHMQPTGSRGGLLEGDGRFALDVGDAEPG